MTKEEQLQKENEELKYDVIDFQERYKEESEYSNELSKKNEKQNAILDILKSYVKVRIDVKFVYVYRIVFKVDGCISCNDITKEQYDLLKEWLDND